MRSAAHFPKLANFDSTKGRFWGSGCQQHLPQNLGCNEDYQQAKCIFISPISILFRTESLKEIKNLIKIEWSILTRTAT